MREYNINYRGIPLRVCGDFTEAEDSVMYDDNMEGYKGSCSFLEVVSVFVEDSNISIFDLFSSADIERIIDLCLD